MITLYINGRTPLFGLTAVKISFEEKGDISVLIYEL
jgi:hypothetical protein